MSTKLRENRNPNRETPELGRVRAAAPRTGGGAGPTGGGVPSDAAQRFTATLTPTWLQCVLARRVLLPASERHKMAPKQPIARPAPRLELQSQIAGASLHEERDGLALGALRQPRERP